MFDVLVLSGAHHDVRARWLTTSMLAHGALVALAAAVTGGAIDQAPPAPTESAVLFFVPKPPPPPPPAATRPPPPETPRLVIAEPPPKGFQTIAAPVEIPTDIPPVDLTQKPLDPRDFTGRGVEGGVADGIVGGTGRVDTGLPQGGLDAIYEATTSDERFQPAVLVSRAEPKYPAALASLGVEGKVSVEFVIDTAGTVEPASFQVLESTHQAFEQAARAVVLSARFRPARLSAHPVRQLSRQAIRFVAAR